MTDKKEKILTAALELFANNGFTATSTSKIAKKAAVSEGLIFRHFENKKGLLAALLQGAEDRLAGILIHILQEEDPKVVIRKTIELPFSVDDEEHDYWKLLFKLKWQSEYNYPQKMDPLINKLTWAFEQLAYQKPREEAYLLQQIIDAISISALRDGIKASPEYQAFLFDKYRV